MVEDLRTSPSKCRLHPLEPLGVAHPERQRLGSGETADRHREACPRHLERGKLLAVSCNDLQSSAAWPDFIAQFRPTFSETQPALRETDLQSSGSARNM
jgi:hypothetical protein